MESINNSVQKQGRQGNSGKCREGPEVGYPHVMRRWISDRRRL